MSGGGGHTNECILQAAAGVESRPIMLIINATPWKQDDSKRQANIRFHPYKFPICKNVAPDVPR